MMNRYTIFLSLLLISFSHPAYSQWKFMPQEITPANANNLVSPFQLPFLHKPPQTRLDTFVEVLMDRNIKHIVLYSKIVDEIGEMKTTEALSLLYLGCKWYDTNHYKNEFTYLCKMLVENGAYKVLNKYFLNSAISSYMPKPEFEKEVLNHCSKLKIINSFSY